MMVFQRLIGALVMIVALFFGGGIAAEPEIFINISSIATTFGVILGGVMFSGRGINKLVSINWQHAESDDLIYAANTYRYMGTLGVAAGGIGTLIGVVLMLANMEDAAMVGMFLAISILTLFYGVVLKYLLFDPIAVRLEDRASNP